MTVIYGLHAVFAMLQTQAHRIKQIFYLESRHDQRLTDLLMLAKQHQIASHALNRAQLNQRSQDAVHQGVMAECTPAEMLDEHDLFQLLDQLQHPPLLLVLDAIKDPHNFGACLRSADAAGVDAVIIPKDKAVGLTATVHKVACGASHVLPIVQVTNLARTLKQLKQNGVWLYGTSDKAEQSLYETSLSGPIAIILGAEDKGIRRLTADNCDVLMSIPMQGSVSSLNVSVATGICLFEALRQRIKLIDG